MRLLVKNIGTIVGIETAGRLRLCGGEMDRLETFDDAWLLADDGRIAAFGSMDSLGEMAADEVVDAGGGMLFPSFCDSHTHLVYAGSREQEFLDKINGLTYEQIARRGGEVARKARPVTIEELTVLGEADGDYALRVRCSKGTYIRTLCNDIGAALGCGGVMSALRRTEVGAYRVSDAHTMDALCALPREAAQRLLLPVDSLWPDAAQRTVDAQAERLARCGNPFRLCAPDGVYRIYAASGEFLLLAQVTDGTAVTIKSFFEVS